MNAARMVRLADGTYKVTFPFDRDAVESIKQMVPPHSRSYDPTERAWHVTSAYRDRIHQLLEDVFFEVEVDDRRDTSNYSPPTSNTPATAYTVLHLQPTAPAELVDAAYRTLARIHHPDAGGSTETMQRLNEAVETIRRRLA